MSKTLRPGFPDYLLVTLQFLLLGAYLFLPGLYGEYLRQGLQIIGGLTMLAGSIVLLWALLQLRENLRVFPTPIAGGHLVTNGIFRWIRHPIYSGIIFMALGYAIYNSSFNHLVMALLIFLFFYIKASYEEERLSQVYPEYESYQLRSGMFLPGGRRGEQFTRNKKEKRSNEDGDGEGVL